MHNDMESSYLMKFRKAKSQDTLEIMAAAAERNATHEQRRAIARAFVAREKEIELTENTSWSPCK